MPTSFPGGLDSFTNPTGASLQSAAVGGRTHAGMHSDINDAVEALQAKVGINGSAELTSLDNIVATILRAHTRALNYNSVDFTKTNDTTTFNAAAAFVDLPDALSNLRTFQFEAGGTVFNNSGANQTINIAVNYNGATVFSDASPIIATSGQARAWRLRGMFAVRSTTVQRLTGSFEIGAADAATTPGVAATSAGIGVAGTVHSFAADGTVTTPGVGNALLAVAMNCVVANANYTLRCTTGFFGRL